jgi:hypothetical protein
MNVLNTIWQTISDVLINIWQTVFETVAQVHPLLLLFTVVYCIALIVRAGRCVAPSLP